LIGPAEALREMNVEACWAFLKVSRLLFSSSGRKNCTQPSAASSFLVAADVTATTVGTP
jgi:hypothetical protein